MNPRELVKSTLEFRNTSGKIPKQMWLLPWATKHFPTDVEKINADFPDDITEVPKTYKEYAKQPIFKGDWYAVGEYTDEWGCIFSNIEEGVIGEVKKPLVADEDYADIDNIHLPEELLSVNIDKINEFCASTDKFVLSSDLVRPFERMQFIRGTEQLFIDLMLKPDGLFKLMEIIHEFNKKLFNIWAKTDVDGLFFMDDWGTQLSLLIDPKLWVEYIKPMYADYCKIAKDHGKKVFFHSDGFTLDIIPHLIEIGVDSANLQIFCIGLENIEKFKGKITFWGEIDRQNILPYASLEGVDRAVNKVYDTLWANGGAIAQCEFGIGANPNNVYQVFKSWKERARQ